MNEKMTAEGIGMKKRTLPDGCIKAVNDMKWLVQELDQQLNSGTYKDVEQTIDDMKDNLDLVWTSLDDVFDEGDSAEEHA